MGLRVKRKVSIGSSTWHTEIGETNSHQNGNAWRTRWFDWQNFSRWELFISRWALRRRDDMTSLPVWDIFRCWDGWYSSAFVHVFFGGIDEGSVDSTMIMAITELVYLYFSLTVVQFIQYRIGSTCDDTNSCALPTQSRPKNNLLVIVLFITCSFSQSVNSCTT